MRKLRWSKRTDKYREDRRLRDEMRKVKGEKPKSGKPRKPRVDKR